MNNYHIVLIIPCKNCIENNAYYKKVLTDLYTKLKCIGDNKESQIKCSGLPSLLFRQCSQFIDLVLPKITFSGAGKETGECVNQLGSQETWIDLNNSVKEIDLGTLLGRLEEVMSSECHVQDVEKSVEDVAEQLHKIADNLSCTGLKLNIYWIIYEHDGCMDISNSISLYGAFKRLQTWNSACIRRVFDMEKQLCCNYFDSWHEGLDISLTNISEITSPMVDPNIVWCGSITFLEDEKITKSIGSDWNLSRASSSTLLQQSNNSVNRNLGSKVDVFEDLFKNVTVICEITQSDIPTWKMLPFKFVLYHNTLINRVFETEILTREHEEFNEKLDDNEATVLLASLEICRDTTASLKKRTTKDWIEFVETGVTYDIEDKISCNTKPNETFYLLLYPIEPGLFNVFFMRPEKSLCNLHSMIAVHQATFLHAKSKQTFSVEQETSLERQWLKWLDNPRGVEPSPFKSQLSLAVHLDASEMLKHFTKDGKPLKKELESLRKQIEEKRNYSPATQKEKACKSELGVDYCTSSNTSSPHSFSPKLFPQHVKHETLSICNTPKTLAKAKLQGTKRKAEADSEKTTNEVSEVGNDPLSSNEMVPDPKAKKTKLSSKSSSDLPNKTSKLQTTEEVKKSTKIDSTDETTTFKKTKKRRSFDGSETSLPQATADTKEKRSERHRRRLVRVVKRTLIKYGVDTKEDYFQTCSERLYYLCKSFLKDLKTSEGLNNEMKRLAESNVATVVEFEKRQRETKHAKEKT